MFKRNVVMAMGLLAVIGCGDSNPGPVTLTPEIEAEQKQAKIEVEQAETERMKAQRPKKSFGQNVWEAEAARQRR